MALSPEEQKEYDSLVAKAGPGVLKSLGIGVAQGITSNTGDEILSGIQSLSPNITYEDALNDNRQTVDLARENHPWATGIGEVAGTIGTGALGAYGLTKAGVGAGLAAYGAAHPYIAASTIGAGQGALSGFGAGEGGLESRITDATTTGLGGAVAGPLATLGLRKVVGPALEAGGTALSRFVNPVDQNFALNTAAPDASSLSELVKSDSDIFLKTAGQRTQSSAAQALEADAIGGVYGDTARSQVKKALTTQNQERKSFVKAMSMRADSPEEVNDILDSVYSRISEKSKALGKQVDNAYEVAREGNSVSINADDISSGLLGEIGKLRAETGANLSDKINYSKSRAAMKALSQKLKAAEGSKITAVKLGDLEDWRKTLTGYANDATGTEKAFLSKVRSSYDNFMIKTANEAVDVGDKDAIMAFRNAVSLRKQYGEMFEKNKIVESVANGKTVDDFAKDLMGSGSIAGKKNLFDNYQALLKAGGDEAPLVKQDLADAFAKRLYTRAAEGFEEGNPEEKFISPAKLSKELRDLFINNKQFANDLYGENSDKIARQAIKELDLIAKKQPGTQNPSGSGFTVARLLRSSVLAKIPGLNIVVPAAESYGKIQGHAKLERGLSDFIDTKPKSSLFVVPGGQAGGAAANATAEPYRVTVRPSDAKRASK